MDWLVAGMIVVVGVLLATQRSTYLVDYAVIVFVFNRGIRRLLDWQAGAFNPLSPISMTPVIVTGLMLLPFLVKFGSLPKSLKTILTCFLVALGYGFLVGFLRIQFAAIYALGEALAPIALFGYILTLGANQQTRDRWLQTGAWCAIIASAYGWYQYLTIPPWDAMWVRAVGFEGYLGQLEPTQLAVFSTFPERGPLGSFLGFAIVPMVLAPKWRTVLGWFGVLLVLSVILLAGTRTGVIVAALSIMVYVMVNRGTGFWQMAIGFSVITAAIWFGMGRLPGGDKLQSRFATLGDMQSDTSFQARKELYGYSVGAVLSNPFGAGLGSTGISGRINTGALDGQAIIGDAGYAEIAAQYGWLGAILIVYALWRMWQELALRFRVGLRTSEVMLARAFMITLVVACFVGNVITMFSILWVVFGAALDPLTFRRYVLALRERVAKASSLKGLEIAQKDELRV